MEAAEPWTIRPGPGRSSRPRSMTGTTSRPRSPRRWRSPTPTGCARRIRSPARRSSTCRRTSSPTARASSSTSTAAPTSAIYRTPEQCWGLEVWHERASTRRWSSARSPSTPPITGCSAHCSTTSPPSIARFVLLDVHSYNHRRDGPDGDADAAGEGARHQHRHLLDAARAMGVPARSADGGDARVRLQRPPARRARECRLPGQGRADPLRPRALSRHAAARSRSSSRNSSWTNGPASPTRPSSTRCAASSTSSPRRRERAAAMNATRSGRRRDAVRAEFEPRRRASPAGRRDAAGSISTGGCRSSSSIARPNAEPSLARRVARRTARPIWSGRPRTTLRRWRRSRRSSPAIASSIGPILLVVARRPAAGAARARTRRSCRRFVAQLGAGDEATRGARRRRSDEGVGADRDRPSPLQGRAGAVRAADLEPVRRAARRHRRRSTHLSLRPAANPSARRTAASIRRLRHDLAVGCGDALLRAACAFLDDGKARRPPITARSGAAPISPPRSRPTASSTAIARSFDFLLSVSPINTDEAFDRFIADGRASRRTSTTGR